mgnify:CR=1 FL=1
MKSITEEMRFRQRLCEYAIKHGVTRAAKGYHTNRQFVYRQLEKYNGDVRSLALKSRRPHNSPKAHTKEELALIRRMLKRNGVYGLAEVFIRCKEKGYTRSFASMCRLNVYDFQATETDTIKLFNAIKNSSVYAEPSCK